MLGIGLSGLSILYDLLDVNGFLREAGRSNMHFRQYEPAKQQKLVKEIMQRYATNISNEQKKAIKEPMDNTLKSFSDFKTKRSNAFADLDDVNITRKNALIEKLNEGTNAALEQASQKIRDQIQVFNKLVDNIGQQDPASSKIYHAEALVTIPYDVRAEIEAALKEQRRLAGEALEAEFLKPEVKQDFNNNQANIDAYKKKMIDALDAFHKEQYEAILGNNPKDPNGVGHVQKSINALHKAANHQYSENFFIAQQQMVFKALAGWKAEKAAKSRGETFSITTTVDGCQLEMENIDLSTLPADLAEMNKERAAKGESAINITSAGGYDIKLEANDDKSCTVSAYIPMKLNPRFHLDPRQNLKDVVTTQLTAAIAMGMLEDGGTIRLQATHKVQKEAENIAIAQYIAAVGMGLKPGEQFTCYINGAKYDQDKMEDLINNPKNKHNCGEELSAAQEQAKRFMKEHKEREERINAKSTPAEREAYQREDEHSHVLKRHEEFKKAFNSARPVIDINPQNDPDSQNVPVA